MKNLLLSVALILPLLGCSSLDLSAVPSSEQETQRILDLGLSHEENLIEASKLDTPHKVAVVTLQLKNARDEKIQAEIDLDESNKYLEAVVVSGQNSKYVAAEISEELNNGVLDTDIDFLRYNLVGTKDINSENLNHKLNLTIIYNSKDKRNYAHAIFCDKWNNCDDTKQLLNVDSVVASNCKNSKCDYTESMSLDLSESFLMDSIDKGFSMRLISKKKTIKIILSKPYLMGYMKATQR